MIRHAVDFDELAQAVDRLRPTWRARADEAVARMRRSKPRRFDPSGPSWGEIKRLYIERQFNKCAYCERRLPDEAFGSIEHDVEHYRPKRSVDPWPEAERHGVSDGNPGGYCMLAYDLRNYCVACKTCNTAQKRSHFPIAGHPGRVDARDIEKLNHRERPCLPFPLGDLDDDPEVILTFIGAEPVPRRKSGSRHKRARVTIDLLALDRREELSYERAEKILEAWWALECQPADAEARLEQLQSGRQPHTACVRAYVRLYLKRRDVAYAFYRQAFELLASAG